jgi:hypothetical protein
LQFAVMFNTNHGPQICVMHFVDGPCCSFVLW